MFGRVREWVTLSASLQVAESTPATRRGEAADALPQLRQRRQAAEVLWTAGSSVEALRLAESAYERAIEIDASVAAPPAGGREVPDAPPLTLDADARAVHAKRFLSLLREVRAVEDRIWPVSVQPGRVRRRRAARWTGIAVIAILLASPMLASAYEAYRAANAPWLVRYYVGTELEGAAVEDSAYTVNHRWQMGAPEGIGPDHFSGRWDTCLRAPSAQTLQISVGVDDGARVFVDGELVLDSWRRQWLVWSHEEVAIEAGVHHIRVEYFENAVAANLQVRLRSDGGPLEGELVRPHDDYETCPE